MTQLRNAWYIAAPARDLGARPIRRAVEGETLALFRDAAGRAQALPDRCAHRGMALSGGRVVGDCIECPYHGWKYDGGGVLREVPALCEGEPLPQVKTMRGVPVAERDGHLWVWIGDAPPVGEPYRFAHYDEPGWTRFTMYTRFAAPVEACLENFLDVPHTLFVHPGLFRGAARTPTRVRVVRTADSVAAEFLDEPELQGFGPRLVFPRGTRMRHTDRFLLPSITRVDYEFGAEHAFVITSQCTAREEFVTDVTTVIAWRLPLPGWLLAPFLRLYCRHVIRQDVDALAVLGRQWQSFGRAQVHTAADVLGRHIQALRRRAAEGGEALAESLEETVMKI